MADLIKEFRDLLAKTTQGEWRFYEVGGARPIELYLDRHTKIELNHSYPKGCLEAQKNNAEFIAKAHNEMPKLLDELEEYKEEYDTVVEIMGDFITRCVNLGDELDRYKKALEVCKEQKRDWAKFGYNSKIESFKQLDIEDKELDQILKGE